MQLARLAAADAVAREGAAARAAAAAAAAARAAVPRISLALKCAYFDANACRSCSLLDVAYPTQLEGKQQRVRALLDPFAPAEGIDWRPLVASAPAGFRTKAKMVVGGTVDAPTLGILDHELHGVDLRDCPIVAPAITDALPVLAAFITRAALIPYDVPARTGELKQLLVTVSPDGELMVRFVLRSTESVPRIRKHLPWLSSVLPALRVATVNLLPEHKAMIEGDEELVLTDAATLTMALDDVALHLRPRSFFQTNEGITRQLYAAGRAWISEFAPASVWDLYCGVGGFALHLADRSATGAEHSRAIAEHSAGVADQSATHGAGLAPHTLRRVVGVEISTDAIESARLTAAESGLDADFVIADATAWATAQGQAPELVVVNPPRRGIGAELASWLEESTAPFVLYSSCNAESLARDLAAMPSLVPVRAQLFDMFPHTEHYEVLTLLRRAAPFA